MADETPTTNPPEEWRPAPGFEGYYEVSNYGDVRRTARGMGTHVGRVLRPYLIGRHGDQRLAVRLQAAAYREAKLAPVHRLVCIAFHGEPPEPHHIVCHNDGNRFNNDAKNLRWDTHANNTADAFSHGRRPYGGSHAWAKLTAEQAREIRRIASGERRPAYEKIAEMFGVNRGTVWAIAHGKSWKLLQ